MNLHVQMREIVNAYSAESPTAPLPFPNRNHSCSSKTRSQSLCSSPCKGRLQGGRTYPNSPTSKCNKTRAGGRLIFPVHKKCPMATYNIEVQDETMTTTSDQLVPKTQRSRATEKACRDDESCTKCSTKASEGEEQHALRGCILRVQTQQLTPPVCHTRDQRSTLRPRIAFLTWRRCYRGCWCASRAGKWQCGREHVGHRTHWVDAVERAITWVIFALCHSSHVAVDDLQPSVR